MRIITERLKAKEMGPADHIRTKHEVKGLCRKNINEDEAPCNPSTP